MTRRNTFLLLILSFAAIALLSPSGLWTGKPIPVDAFNRRVAKAHQKGDKLWTESALQVACEFVGDHERVGSRTIIIDNKAERFSSAMVTIMEEGYQDDSVAGSIYRLRMKKADGYWQIQSAQRQWKCQEGRGHTWWSCGTCS